MSRAFSDGEPEIVSALPHPQSLFFVAVEKHDGVPPLVIVVVVAAGEKADATAATMMRVPTTRTFLMVFVVKALHYPLLPFLCTPSAESADNTIHLHTSHPPHTLCAKRSHYGGIGMHFHHTKH